jgi:amino acid adenylation domain-containing protein
MNAYRLSSQQQDLWRSQRSGDALWSQCAVRLSETAGVDAALARIVARHEILRVGFSLPAGLTVPFQVVADLGRVRRRGVDGGPGGTAAAVIQGVMRDERQAPVDLDQGPPVRVCVVGGANGPGIVVLSVVALCADAWTMNNLVTAIGAGAEAGSAGETIDDSIDYIDYSEWQHELGEGGGPSPEPAPDRSSEPPAPPRADSRFSFLTEAAGDAAQEGCRVAVDIPVELGAAVIDLAARMAVEPAAVLLACWQTLLWRLTGEDIVTVDLVCDGRADRRLQGSFGLFARTVPVSWRFEAGQPFDRVVEAADENGRAAAASEVEAASAGLEHTPRPADGVIAGFEYIPDLCTTPVSHTGASIVARHHDLRRETIKLTCWRNEHLHAHVQSDGSVPPARVEYLALLLGRLLHEIVQQPAQAVLRLPILHEDGRRQLLAAATARRAPSPAGTFAALFEAQAARTPQAAAVASGGRRLTYAEVNARGDAVAARLRAAGVGAETPVALLLERSVELAVGLVAVLKAGGAYVPLDPQLPAARLRAQLAAVGARVLVAHAATADRVPAFDGTVLWLDAAAAPADAVGPGRAVVPEQLAYVIFTSGSTGTPKAVGVTQGNLVQYAQAVAAGLGAAAGWQFATVSTIAADLGNTCIFPAWLVGGTVHLVAPALAMDAAALAGYMTAEGIDVLKIVPSHLSALLAGDRPARLLPARWLVLGGEALRPGLLGQVQGLAPGLRVWNHYGPTETTVGALVYEASGGTAGAGGTLPIGRPLGAAAAYVLDAQGALAPWGATGELYIGGGGVSRGYLGQAGATAARFLPDGFGSRPGARLYRTGDRVRRGADGAVEFLGRVDAQVKIRGFRVEPGEIDAALRAEPAVHDCAVIAAPDAGGETRLIAYCVARSGQTLHEAALRASLGERLPDAMIPAAFVLLDRLPLTSNGKLDRRALPPVQQPVPCHRLAAAVPPTPVEELLVGLWAGLLGRDRFDVDANYFELGGHSLQAMQMVSRIRQAFGVEISLKDFFDGPTCRALAARIVDIQTTREGLAVDPPRRATRDGGVVLSSAQSRVWFYNELEPGNPSYIVPAAVLIEGPLDAGALTRSLNEVVRRHESLRTIFPSVNGRPLQVVLPSLSIEVPASDLDPGTPEDQQAQFEALAAAFVRAPFTLSRPPLVRAWLARFHAEKHALVLAMHHLVCDGWSTGILIREMTALYEAFRARRLSPLADLPLQYPDFARWQHEWLRGPVCQRQLAYWRRHLGGALPVLEIQRDFPRPRHQTFNGAHETFFFSRGLTTSLGELSVREGVTLFMTLMAGFKALLYRYSGEPDVIVGTGIAHRPHRDCEDLIGFFVNTLALRTNLSGNPTFGELLQRVRDVTLNAYIHQDLPFEKVVEDLQPKRDPGRHPIFQVLFHLQNFPSPPLTLADLTVSRLSVPTGAVNFDLTLSIVQRPEGLRATLDYNTDLFAAASIRRIRDHLLQLFEAVAAHPRTRLLDIPLAPSAAPGGTAPVGGRLGVDEFDFRYAPAAPE